MKRSAVVLGFVWFRSRRPRDSREPSTIVVLGLVLATLLAPLAPDAQAAARVARIGFLGNVPPPIFDAFRQSLRDLGWVEGQNLALERRAADGREDRLADLAAELVRLKVDVIVAPGPVSVRAARQATATIPIVMVASSDPVAEGWIVSLARPGGNVTGLTVAAAAEFAGKQLELLKESASGVRRVGVLMDANGDTARWMKLLENPAQALRLQLHPLVVRGPDELVGAFAAAIKLGAGALFVWTTPMLHVHQPRIVELTVKHRLPAIALFKDFAETGGLMAYGPNLPGLFRRAAAYVDRILKGANPAEMPVEQPARPELTLNLRRAKVLGLTIPRSVLVQADHVIQ